MEKLIEITAEIKIETDKAFLLSDDGENEEWFPKSQLNYDPDSQVGDIVHFEMPEWLAIEKEFI